MRSFHLLYHPIIFIFSAIKTVCILCHLTVARAVTSQVTATNELRVPWLGLSPSTRTPTRSCTLPNLRLPKLSLTMDALPEHPSPHATTPPPLLSGILISHPPCKNVFPILFSYCVSLTYILKPISVIPSQSFIRL